MNLHAAIGWGLAVLAVAVGYATYGWKGVVLGLTVVVFWMLLQFSRAMRAMRLAGQAPVGQVGSAVMLHARLQKGQRLLDILQLTGSLGHKLADPPDEAFAWDDASGARVELRLRDGRLREWTLVRPKDDAPAPGA